MEFEKLLRLMVEKGGSDLFITAGVPPSMKVNGKVLPVTKNALTPEQTMMRRLRITPEEVEQLRAGHRALQTQVAAAASLQSRERQPHAAPWADKPKQSERRRLPEPLGGGGARRGDYCLLQAAALLCFFVKLSNKRGR